MTEFIKIIAVIGVIVFFACMLYFLHLMLNFTPKNILFIVFSLVLTVFLSVLALVDILKKQSNE